MQVEIADGNIVIDAELLGRLLNVPASDLQELMRTKTLTSICERGEGEDEGKYRLSFFYRNRRLRLKVDKAGHVLQHSTVDFGDRPLPRQRQQSGG